jgi:hypothetical protein
VKETFDGADLRLHVHLSPPLLSPTDKAGRPRKIVFGPWMFGLAVGLAAIPEEIRGFGHVKMRHLAAAKADEAALLEQFRAGTPPLLKAAE